MATPNDTSPRYALLLGQGRSGTNYPLKLLDQSPFTHCRNEADQLRDGALARLSRSRYFRRDDAELEERWDDAVRDASSSLGARDHVTQHAKRWLRPGARRPGYFWMRQRYRVQQRLSGAKAMDTIEARFPRWMASRSGLREAFHVFKLNAACGLASWMFDHRPEGKAIHIVRHPGGFTKSWLRRWAEQHDRQQTEDATKARLRELHEFDPRWRGLTGEVEPMSMIEAELWFWRYVNESIHTAGQGQPGYLPVVYEELTQQPDDVARRVYEFCDLPWSDWVGERVREISRGSKAIAAAWKDELEPDVVETIERVLAGSVLETWWEERRLSA